jgi:hypothetical protein
MRGLIYTRQPGDGARDEVRASLTCDFPNFTVYTRFVLAATEHLHKRIAKISDRVRQLEDALAALQAKHSNEPHPLLRDDLLSVNAMHDDDDIGKVDEAAPSHPPEIMDAFGTLSISDHGVSRFFGPTGGPEVSISPFSSWYADRLT